MKKFKREFKKKIKKITFLYNIYFSIIYIVEIIYIIKQLKYK